MNETSVINNSFGLEKYPTVIALNSAISLFAVLENSLILLLFMQQRKTLEVSHKFIISMATADLLEGLFGAPLTCFMAAGLRSDSTFCLVTLAIKITIHVLTVFCVVMTSVDRFWAICTPLMHRYRRTETVVKIMITTCWVVPVILGIVGFTISGPALKADTLCFPNARFNVGILKIVAYGINIPAMILMFLMYLIIYFKLLKVSDYSPTKLLIELQDLMKAENIATEDDNVSLADGIKKKDIRMAILVFMTVVSFWICWGSIVIVTIILNYNKNSASNVSMRFAVQTIVAVNSCVNPILYGFHIKKTKEATKKLLRKCCWFL